MLINNNMYFICQTEYFQTCRMKGIISESMLISISILMSADLTSQHVPSINEDFVIVPIDNTFMQNIISHNSFNCEDIGYVVITCDSLMKELLIKTKSRFLFYHSTDEFDFYLEMAKNLVNCDYVPTIGTYSNPNSCAAGMLPIVYHNGEMFCLMGIDNNLTKYSDFGGSFDVVYTKHKIDTYKNTILKNKQINNGNIDTDILNDHKKTLAALNDNFSRREISSDKYIHPNHSSLKNRSNYHYDQNIGYGDPNTLYTAFRELMEETSYVDKNGDVCYVFDLDMIMKKIYKDRSYVYLGGDKQYKYDMYVIILNVDDLKTDLQSWFLNMYTQYKSNETKYVSECTNNILRESLYTISNNKEMIGIDMIPLSYIVDYTTKINYKHYRICKQESKYTSESKMYRNCYQNNRHNDYSNNQHNNYQNNQHNNYQNNQQKRTKINHAKTYSAPILDNMRSSFADALVKYSIDFAFLANPKSFGKIKSLFHLT